jgi:hypothetical protein
MYTDSKNRFVSKNASLLQQLNCIHKWANDDDKEKVLKFFDDHNEGKKNNVLPETANKLFGSRRASFNMRKLNQTVHDISRNSSKRNPKRKVMTNIHHKIDNSHVLSISPNRYLIFALTYLSPSFLI